MTHSYCPTRSFLEPICNVVTEATWCLQAKGADTPSHNYAATHLTSRSQEMPPSCCDAWLQPDSLNFTSRIQIWHCLGLSGSQLDGEFPGPTREECYKLSSKVSRNKGTVPRELLSGREFGSPGWNRRNWRWLAKSSSGKQLEESRYHSELSVWYTCVDGPGPFFKSRVNYKIFSFSTLRNLNIIMALHTFNVLLLKTCSYHSTQHFDNLEATSGPLEYFSYGNFFA